MSTMQFWKPGTTAPGSTLDRATQAEDNIIHSAPASSNLGIQAQRERLPIFKHREKILYAVEKYGVVIIVGQTGCGKTTQLPQYLYEAGWAANGNVIACTQPRRVAATSVAARVATEVGTVLGDEVGYTIRFEDVSSKSRTRIKYMTDGMLFRETMLDPLLSKYSVIMVDEAHERSIYTDLLLGVLKKIRRKRPSLRLIVSSATLEAKYFLEYFNSGPPVAGIGGSIAPTDNPIDEATIVSLEGRMYPVEVAYLKEPTEDYVSEAVRVVWGLHMQPGQGDILVFLTGREEIDRCLSELSELVPRLPRGAPELVPLPLHAGLSTDDQLAVFQPAERGTRKVVVSTNIAEASVTIDGIRFVVDCGFVKIRTFNPANSLSSLSIVPTSQASATQRSGRAGRTAPGICYRLYPEFAFKTLSKATPPEITRTDLTTPLLQLKSLGINDLMKFEWLSPPPSESLLRALEGLIRAGMIDQDGVLTEVGAKVSECPVEVTIAGMLFSSKEYRCGQEILTIAAMTSVQDAFVIPDGAAGALAELERRKFTAEEGDHLTLLNAYNAFVRYGQSASWCRNHALNFRALSRAVSIRTQLKKYMTRFADIGGTEPGGLLTGRTVLFEEIRCYMCILTPYVYRKPRTGWVVYHEMEETKKTQIRILTEIEPDWLLEYGHKYLDKRSM
ncbi:Helicase associated domain (HA2) [Rhizoctonia solani]|uniref:RNA helicase n=1 Tax=Rhizoctonia solani TaxID=456999 RepID=A0A8H8T1Z6_9AGAM|nr:Helicase associated domain (HA2) [Rhizoctonia solani]QRW26981.1 Helicase associated domain (HA2) [Rhizoctonia solani]